MRHLLAFTAAVAIAGILVVHGGTVAAATDDGPLGCGIVWDSEITYTVETGSSSVGVEGESTLTYPEGASPGCTTNQISIPVPPAIFGLEAHSPTGDRLSATIELPEKEGLSALAFINLPGQLGPGESLTISFSYWMPDDDAFTLASAEQLSFQAWVWGTPGHISLTVATEPGDTLIAGTPIQPDGLSGARGVYRYPAIANPDDWSGAIAVFKGPARSAIDAHASAYPTTLHAIDEERGWVEVADSGVAIGVPTLEKLIGIDWPDWKPLDVIEVKDQALAGYAGRYLPTFHAIQLPTNTPQSTMLHELGHAWFNGDLFTDTWVSEGFADLYAYVAESSIPDTDGYEPIAALPVDAHGPGSSPLVEWEAAEAVETGTEANVEYGYGASYWILSQIEDEIGVEAVSAVVLAAWDEARQTGESVDSRRLLELLETVGGSRQAPALFAEYGAASARDTAAERAGEPGTEPGIEPAVGVTQSGSRGVSPVVLTVILLPVVAGFGMVYRSRRKPSKKSSVPRISSDEGQATASGTALAGIPSYLTSTQNAESRTDVQSEAGAETPWVY